jgi:hypothetical protein
VAYFNCTEKSETSLSSSSQLSSHRFPSSLVAFSVSSPLQSSFHPIG